MILYKSYNDWLWSSIRLYDWVPSVTTILSVLKEPNALIQLKKYNKDKLQSIMKEAADRWTILHAKIENVYKTGKPLIPKSTREYSFTKFYSLKWKKWKPIKLEYTIKTNIYAGTLDAIMKIDWKQYLVDWKTVSQRTYPEFIRKYKLQLSAYGQATNINSWILVFLYGTKPKYEILKVDNLKQYYNAFKEALDLFNIYYDSYKSSDAWTHKIRIEELTTDSWD